MQHRLAHRVGRSSQATTAAVDKSHPRLTHRNSDIPAANVHRPAAETSNYERGIAQALGEQLFVAEEDPVPGKSLPVSAY